MYDKNNSWGKFRNSMYSIYTKFNAIKRVQTQQVFALLPDL